MPSARNRFAPVRRQLDAYEESWKEGDRGAMACRDCEDLIAAGLSVFRLLGRTDNAWRDRVFRGAEAYAEQDDRSVRDLFRAWLRVTESLLAELPPLEKAFGHVEGADELRSGAEEARQVVAGWSPPRLSAAVGLREMTLSPEAAAELERILGERGHLPPEPAGPRIEEMSAAELKRSRSG